MEGEGKKGRAAITMTIWRNDRAQLDTQHGSQIYYTFISGKIVC